MQQIALTLSNLNLATHLKWIHALSDHRSHSTVGFHWRLPAAFGARCRKLDGLLRVLNVDEVDSRSIEAKATAALPICAWALTARDSVDLVYRIPAGDRVRDEACQVPAARKSPLWNWRGFLQWSRHTILHKATIDLVLTKLVDVIVHKTQNFAHYEFNGDWRWSSDFDLQLCRCLAVF